ncbi:MAG: FixH family protein [Mariprofundaceae bacterium]
MAIDPKTEAGAAKRSPWMWAILGLFVIIFAVNYGFVVASSSTSSGLVNEEYYKYGLQQNKIDAQLRAQRLRGWQLDLTLPQDWQVDQSHILQLSVRDKMGRALSGGQAEITAYRPSDANADIVIQLKEIEAGARPGLYTGELAMHLPGVWDINLLFVVAGKKHMLNQRIHVSDEGLSGSAAPSLLEQVVHLLIGE